MRTKAAQSKSRRLVWGIAIASAASAAAAPAQAAIVIDFAESGGDVVATTSGSFDTAGLNYDSTQNFSAGVNPNIAAFDSTSSNADVFNGIAGPASFGAAGGSFEFASSSTGDMFGFFGQLGQVRVPGGFVSGSLSATTTFAGQTFASLGLAPGTYVYNAPNDTITVNIGTTAVPEPSTWAMVLVGFGAIGLGMRRRFKAGPRASIV